MKKSLLTLSVLAATATTASAADYSDGDIHKNDYKWSQFNLMYAVNELPGGSDHDYLEMEFGGRSGIFDIYGYVDIFNLSSSDSSDKDGSSKMFMKFAPRVSLDALTAQDLSFGPLQEVYLASLFNWGGGADNDVNNAFVGIGSDVMVPWLGKVGVNLYALYAQNEKDWNGYQLSTNWFKPVYFFENGSFLSYQGYIDYQFGMKDKYATADNGGVMFNGIYWHTDRFAAGYGLKGFKDVYGIKDSSTFESTGFAHYVAVTYKF